MPHDVMPVGPGSASGATVVEGEREFSIMRGGPFLDILHTLRLIDRDGHVRWVLLVALVWGPMIVAAMLRGVRGRPIDVVIFDPTVHVRLLLSIPLLLLAERLLEARAPMGLTFSTVTRSPSRCSHCGTRRSAKVRMVAGLNAYICELCLRRGIELLDAPEDITRFL